MKTKHTPGPWNVEPEWNPGEGFTITAPTARHRIDGERGCICNFAWSPFVEAKEANARLIAAAPEMHDALCHLLEWAKGNRGRKDVNPYSVPEVKCALQVLAGLQGRKDYLDAETDIGVLPADERTNRLHHRPA